MSGRQGNTASGANPHTWQSVQKELRRRISERIWAPDSVLPTETELAQQFGCARATVNRAMRELVEDGLLERRRKAGTRVVRTPVRRATLAIPITRLEIERRGARWHHTIIEQKKRRPPAILAAQLTLPSRAHALHLRSVHFADRKPFVYEDRWINTAAVPDIEGIDLHSISANEWLVENAPFTSGEFTLSAANASASEAQLLGTEAGTALVIVDRMTFNGEQAVTSVRLAYAPGHRIHTTL